VTEAAVIKHLFGVIDLDLTREDPERQQIL